MLFEIGTSSKGESLGEVHVISSQVLEWKQKYRQLQIEHEKLQDTIKDIWKKVDKEESEKQRALKELEEFRHKYPALRSTLELSVSENAKSIPSEYVF